VAYDKVVDSTVLENGLSSIADAIREKGNLGDPLMSPLNFPSGFVSALEGLSGGGDVVIGEITFTSDQNVTLTDAFPVRSQAPKAFFWFEEGIAFNDTTHTKRRPLVFAAARSDGGTTIDTAGRYTYAYMEAPSSSNKVSANGSDVTNLFNRTAPSTSNTYTNMVGNYNTGTLYFGVKSLYNGFIQGRTYVWGVIPWDE